ncbi:acyltransferase [Microbacterium oxydans]|nr:acyltransferase [Microbacterium oxydans]
MSAPLPTAAPPSAAPRERVFRTDIQALRAVAIGLVVLNHLWPTRITGGYVGVDVFFVISGFLITGHLVGEMTRTGGVRLGAFYARRIRRLLPAAFVVLAVSLVLLIAFLPYPRWARNAWEIAASAGYVENWYLAAMSVNYSALNDAASMVQHYWSLSVEEQFYIVWPLLLLAALAASARLGRRSSRPGGGERSASRALLLVVTTVGVLSLGASIVYTILAPSQAYFATFTRGWEFAVGGAVALLGARLRLPRIVAQIVSILGFVLIAFSAFAYDHTTSFPGYAALVPVLGTAAVIVAGTSYSRLWHARVTALPPVQWVGGISYSLYLWHWPLIVAAPFVIGAEASTLSKVGVLAISIVLAGPHEDLRRGQGAEVALLAHVDPQSSRSHAGRHGRDRRPRRRRARLVPDARGCRPTSGRGRRIVVRGSAGDGPWGGLRRRVRSGGVLGDDLEERVLLHAAGMWDVPADPHIRREADDVGVRLLGKALPTRSRSGWSATRTHSSGRGAIFDIARENNWIVTTSYLGGCPVADVDFLGFRGPWGQAEADRCNTWSDDLAATIRTAKPDLVVTAMAARQDLVDDGSGASAFEQMSAGLIDYWTAWADEGIDVLAIADPPYNGEVRGVDCVLLNSTGPCGLRASPGGRAAGRPRPDGRRR